MSTCITRRRRLAAAAWAACALLACGAAAAAGNRSGAATASGGTMTGTSVKWVGGGPWMTGTEEKADVIDPSPVVLWSGDRVAAVLAYRAKTELFGLRRTRSFRRVDGGPSGPFPLETSQTLQRGDAEEGYDTGHVITADVDGDGTDELILPRWRGGVDVAGVKAALKGSPGLSVKASVATYRPRSAQVARLAGGAVVHVLFERYETAEETPKQPELERAGAPDPYVLVRVDRGGARRIVLGEPGFRFTSVLGVGAINRPGSTVIDELVVLSQRDRGEDVFLSRHRPDGAPIAPARQVYHPLNSAGSWSFAFIPQSTATVAHAPDVKDLFFVEAHKPANWIRRVDLKPLLGAYGHPEVTGVVDAQSSAKAIVSTGKTVVAVDVEGTPHAWSGGALAPVKDATPLCAIPLPGPMHELKWIVPSTSRPDEWMVVHTRARQPRPLTHEEIAEAADRYLRPEEVEKERRRATPSLTDRDAVRDGFIEAERKRRGIDAEIQTVEEWKRLLPDSYAETEKFRRGILDGRLKVSLTIGLDNPKWFTTEEYRDPEGARAWLATIVLRAETVFTLCRRGAVVRELRMERQLAQASLGELSLLPVDWRDGPSGTTVVAGFDDPTAPQKPAFQFAVLTSPAVR